MDIERASVGALWYIFPDGTFFIFASIENGKIIPTVTHSIIYFRGVGGSTTNQLSTGIITTIIDDYPIITPL